MFRTRIAERIGDAIRWNAGAFRDAISRAFQNAILNEKKEVSFFRKLLREVKINLDALTSDELRVVCRVKEVHQKPRVKVTTPRTFQCELADLLVVVKYAIDQAATERKSLLYQVKLCDSGTSLCKVDLNQLELLSDWPKFEFGRLGNGGPAVYSLEPKTLEFGSFMLMQRSPGAGQFVPCRTHFCNLNAYGVSPHALAVKRFGSQVVDIASFPYASNAAELFFSHLAFEIGEHHDYNPLIANLVWALYRHLQLDPDPPNEFEGYMRVANEDEPGFAIIEITVNPGKAFDKNSNRGDTRTFPDKKSTKTAVGNANVKRMMKQGG